MDGNDFVRKVLPQPRIILNWLPRNAMKFSLGWGIYDEPVFLSLIGQSEDQQRTDILSTAPLTPIVTSFSRIRSLQEPYFQTTSVEWEKSWNAQTTSRIHFMERRQ